MSELPRGLDPHRPYVCPKCGSALVVKEVWRTCVSCPVDPATGEVQRPVDTLTILEPPDPGARVIESQLSCTAPRCANRPRRFYTAVREYVQGGWIARLHLDWTYGKPTGVR